MGKGKQKGGGRRGATSKSSQRGKPSRGAAKPTSTRAGARTGTPSRSRRGDDDERPRRGTAPARRTSEADAIAAGDASAAAVLRAKLSVHPQGFGFAERDDGGGTVFIPAAYRGGAMDGDEVLVTARPAERGLEGVVRSVVVRRRTRLTGVLRRERGRLVLEPDDPRVLDPIDVAGELPPEPYDMVVLADIVEYPLPIRPRLLVTIDRVLGRPGRLATEQIKILIEHGVDPEFPPAVLAAAEHVPTEVRPEDRVGRADLRPLPFVTIDPPDARDFDDAVCFEPGKGDQVRVHVAVADVSHYVREGDPFDTEAAIRCFSCYLPDRAIPMLPPQLSSNICSLVPKQERLAMVVSFDVDGRGHVSDVEVRAAMIESRARLTYDQAAAMIAKGGGDAIADAVVALREIADRLRRARMRRGAVELHLPEIKVKLDQDDPERVRSVEHARADPSVARAYNLIEELMLAANEAVGDISVRQRLPALFRVHAAPDEARLERFCAIADLLGVEADPEELRTPKGMQAFLRRTAKHHRRGPLHSLLLRAMAQAEYQGANIGHFALASPAYLHFTSPIRRYADLVDHRVLKAWLRRVGGSAGPEPVPRMPERQASVATAVRASERERHVAQAERDAKALLVAAFMRDRIGDRFEATITGMGNAGAWVTLDEPPVDGMIRRNALEREAREVFVVDELQARMIGENTGDTLAIGDRVVVEIVDASIARRQIEVALVRRLSA